jgi:hypothetical protein
MPHSKILELVIRSPFDLDDAKSRYARKARNLGYTLDGPIEA